MIEPRYNRRQILFDYLVCKRFQRSLTFTLKRGGGQKLRLYAELLQFNLQGVKCKECGTERFFVYHSLIFLFTTTLLLMLLEQSTSSLAMSSAMKYSILTQSRTLATAGRFQKLGSYEIFTFIRQTRLLMMHWVFFLNCSFLVEPAWLKTKYKKVNLWRDKMILAGPCVS